MKLNKAKKKSARLAKTRPAWEARQAEIKQAAKDAARLAQEQGRGG